MPETKGTFTGTSPWKPKKRGVCELRRMGSTFRMPLRGEEERPSSRASFQHSGPHSETGFQQHPQHFTFGCDTGTLLIPKSPWASGQFRGKRSPRGRT